MKKVKIIISTFLITTVSMSFIACGKAKENTQSENKSSSTQSTDSGSTKTTDTKHPYQKDASLPGSLHIKLVS